MQLLATVVGGTPGRLMVAYCEKGPLDANMKKAAADLGAFYGLAAVACTLGAVIFPPLALMAPFCGAAAAVFSAMGQGGLPNPSDVDRFTGAMSNAKRGLGSPIGPTATDAAGGLQAAWQASSEVGGIAGRNEPSNSVSSSTSCAMLEAAAKQEAARDAAKAKAKALARARTLACTSSGGTWSGGVCVNPSKDAAKAKAKAETDAARLDCASRGGTWNPGTGCSVATSSSSSSSDSKIPWGPIAVAGAVLAKIVLF